MHHPVHWSTDNVLHNRNRACRPPVAVIIGITFNPEIPVIMCLVAIHGSHILYFPFVRFFGRHSNCLTVVSFGITDTNS